MNKKFVRAFAPALALLLLFGCNRHSTPPPTPAPTPPPLAESATPAPSPGPTAFATSSALALPSVTPQSPEATAPMLAAKAGIIPAEQTFVSYSSADGHYDIQVPQSWTPAVLDGDASFTSGYDGLQVKILQFSAAFTMESILSTQVADLIRTGRAVTVKNVSSVTEKGGSAFLVEYDSNSEPADGKQVRLSNQTYYFYNNGSLAALTMWAPAGLNNANVWKQIPDTFFWR